VFMLPPLFVISLIGQKVRKDFVWPPQRIVKER